MTKEQMEHGQQIQYDLSDLKRALSQISRASIFSIDTSPSCSGRYGDSFLAELETELKTRATAKINQRIASLEKEFKSL